MNFLLEWDRSVIASYLDAWQSLPPTSAFEAEWFSDSPSPAETILAVLCQSAEEVAERSEPDNAFRRRVMLRLNHLGLQWRREDQSPEDPDGLSRFIESLGQLSAFLRG